MKGRKVLGLAAACSLWLLGGVLRVQGADVKHFQAMNLERFAWLPPSPQRSWFVIDKEGVIRYATTTHWSVFDKNDEVLEVLSKL